MPELKHTFSSGKMNKDLDERLVPNGEYRDALNIEVATSEGSNVGAAQTLKGNLVLNNTTITGGLDVFSENALCVGSIADEKNDNIYYFVHDFLESTDYILEYSRTSNVITPVVVDIWQTEAITTTTIGNANHFLVSNLGSTRNETNIRAGMAVQGAWGTSGFFGINYESGVVVNRMKQNSNNEWEVYLEDTTGSNFMGLHTQTGLYTPAGMTITFLADRVLNFSFDTPITGINIIDDLLFWTDGKNEPKKINITRSKEGTDSSGKLHSWFYVYDSNDNLIDDSSTKVSYRSNPLGMKEEHITVIKKSPLYPPALKMSLTSDGRFGSDGNKAIITGQTHDTVFTNHDQENMKVGDYKNIIFTTPFPNYKVGDTILLRNSNIDIAQEHDQHPWFWDDYHFSAEILESTVSTGVITAKIQILWVSPEQVWGGFDPNDDPVADAWYTLLKQEKPLFEVKFPKFAYRYRYQDGEYSCYSPFSEPAFMPNTFDYIPKEGYNTGMVNQLRSLHVMDFVPDNDTRPKGVVAVDILYKESDSSNVYTVKTIKDTDEEWTAYGSAIAPADGVQNEQGNQFTYNRTSGSLKIESEMIHAVVPANQLLRPWDNVPRWAKAQEVTGNRLVYANYVQNYNIKTAL